jgi:hypothetical protein
MGGSTSSGGASAGGAGNPDAGVRTDAMSAPVDAYIPCSVNIAAVPSASSPSTTLYGLKPGDNASLTVKATITWGSMIPTQPTWQWTVKGPDGTPLAITPIPITEKNPTTIQFPLLAAGTYDISVSATSSCKGRVSATAVKPQDQYQSMFFRFLPPPSANSGQTCNTTGPNRWCPSEDAVPFESNYMIQANQPLQADVQLPKGYVVSIDPRQVNPINSQAFPAVTVASYIRIAPRDATWTLDGESSNALPMRALLHPGLQYDVLVIPNVPGATDTSQKSFPPFLVTSKEPQQFLASDFDVAAGVAVRGTLRTASGPAVGARILLRSEANSPATLPLPSTIGTTDATGAYSLLASKDARFSAVLIPPPGSSLPQITVSDCLDLDGVSNGTTLSNVNFTWNNLSTTTLVLRVLMSDNTVPSKPITVRLQSQDGALADAGVMTIDNNQVGAISGLVRMESATDATGSVTFSGIPKAAYQMVLAPPSDLAQAATTTGNIDLSGTSGNNPRTLLLARKVKLSGRLKPADAASGARLVATDTGTDVLVSIISATVASDGSYAFLADPGRTYRFSVEPAPGKNLPSRIPLYGVTTTDQDAQLADRTLPSGLKVSGTVKFLATPVSGAIVQAYCKQPGLAGCMDPTKPDAPLPQPLVEITTLTNGSFSFYLPDPATGG